MKNANLAHLFDFVSIFPLIFLLSGLYILYLFFTENFSLGFIVMMVVFVFYIIHNVILNFFGGSSVFNEFLEDICVFLVFGVSVMVFGLLFYAGDFILLLSVFFFSVCTVIGLARNWVLRVKNSVGFPVALNGLIFPLVYFFYVFYLDILGSSVFVVYFLVIGLLAITKINFLGYSQFMAGSSILHNKGEESVMVSESKAKVEVSKPIVSKHESLKSENIKKLSNNKDLLSLKSSNTKQDLNLDKSKSHSKSVDVDAKLEQILVKMGKLKRSDVEDMKR